MKSITLAEYVKQYDKQMARINKTNKRVCPDCKGERIHEGNKYAHTCMTCNGLGVVK